MAEHLADGPREHRSLISFPIHALLVAKHKCHRPGRDVLRRFGWSALLGGHFDHRVRDKLG